MAIPRRNANNNSSNQQPARRPDAGQMPQMDAPMPEMSQPAPSFDDIAPRDNYTGRPPVENPYDTEDVFEPVPLGRNDFEHHDEVVNEIEFEDDESYSLPNEDESISNFFEDEDEEPDHEESYDDYEPADLVPPKTKVKNRKELEKGEKRRKNGDFVDKKNKKLVPFGGKRSAKVSEFDKRKDVRKQRQFISWGLIGVGAGLLLYGIYSIVVPPQQLTEEEVATIASIQMGDTGFPTEAGAAYAQDFMEVYLNLGANAQEDRTQLLNYYYTGNMLSDIGSNTNISYSNVNQKTILGPTVFEKNALTENSASYVIGSYVEVVPVSLGEEGDAQPAEKERKWLFFNVNVYYNDETMSYRITQDSPTLIPDYQMEEDNIPDGEPIGDGTVNEDAKTEVNAVVTGFIRNYATSSASNPTPIEPYITSNSDIELKQGYDNKVAVDDSTSAITYTVYNNGDEGTTLRLHVNVNWTDELSEESSLTYTSQYVMWLDRGADGKYLVSRFAPYYYVPEIGE